MLGVRLRLEIDKFILYILNEMNYKFLIGTSSLPLLKLTVVSFSIYFDEKINQTK